MRRAVLFLLLLLALPATASATWSVIAVDRSTGRVVIASATCVDRDDQFLMGVQAVVVPGKGVAACQAGVDNTHQNQMLVFRELEKGTDPKAIIEQLSADPAFQTRQFGIVDLQGRSAGHSGLTNGYVSQDIHGQVPGTEIFYSIQGNILRPGTVVPNAVQAFLAAKGRDHRSGDGGDGGGRRIGRRQPVHLPAVADRRIEAGDSVLGEDRACRLHPDGGEGRHQRRLAQQRQVHDVSHRVAAGAGSRAERDSRGREPQPGEDAAHALRRVAQDAAGVVQVTP